MENRDDTAVFVGGVQLSKAEGEAPKEDVAALINLQDNDLNEGQRAKLAALINEFPESLRRHLLS